MAGRVIVTVERTADDDYDHNGAIDEREKVVEPHRIFETASQSDCVTKRLG